AGDDEDNDDGHTGSQPGFAPAATVPMGLEPAQAAVAELSGDIQGEATEALEMLERARNESPRLVVSCA
ncbi:MAG: hypothetical protein KDH18_15950, partial [Rhodoferax sp.]|nr:hypothetical protein [Rhodoferax sp.]